MRDGTRRATSRSVRSVTSESVVRPRAGRLRAGSLGAHGSTSCPRRRAWSSSPAPASPRAPSSPRSSYDAGLDWLTLMWWRFLIGAGTGLAVGAGLADAAGDPPRDAATAGRRRARAGGRLHGQRRDLLRRHRDGPGGPGRGARLHLPGLRRLLSLRFATRLPGRRPWIALGLAVVGVVLALGGIDLDVRRACRSRACCSSSPRPRSTRSGSCSRRGCPGERRDRLGQDAPSGAAPRQRRGGHHGADDGRDGDRVRGDGRGPWAVARSAERARAMRGRTSWGSGCVASFLAIQTLYAGARRVGAAQAALISTTEPLFIVVLAFFVLDQTLAPIQLVGCGVHPGRRRHRPDVAAPARCTGAGDAARRRGRGLGLGRRQRPAAASIARAPALTYEPSDPRPTKRKPSSRCRCRAAPS